MRRNVERQMKEANELGGLVEILLQEETEDVKKEGRQIANK